MKRHFNCKLTVEQEQEAKELYQGGTTIVSLKEKYGVGRKAIEGALKRQGIVLNQENDAQRKRKATPQQEKEMTELYLSGIPAHTIAQKYNYSSHRHIIKILRRNNAPIRGHRKYHLNKNAFDAIDNELKHYWLGFIYADGTVNRNALRIGLSPKDKIQLVKIRDFMKSNHPIRQTDICVSIDFFHIHLASQLAEKGIIARRGRFDLTLPHIQTEHQHHFIRGYLDGDGCISTTEQVIFLGQIDILSWIRDTLHKECQANITKIRQRQGIHEISWGGINQARKIVDYIYHDSVIWLERKRLIAENWRCGA